MVLYFGISGLYSVSIVGVKATLWEYFNNGENKGVLPKVCVCVCVCVVCVCVCVIVVCHGVPWEEKKTLTDVGEDLFDAGAALGGGLEVEGAVGTGEVIDHVAINNPRRLQVDLVADNVHEHRLGTFSPQLIQPVADLLEGLLWLKNYYFYVNNYRSITPPPLQSPVD